MEKKYKKNLDNVFFAGEANSVDSIESLMEYYWSLMHFYDADRYVEEHLKAYRNLMILMRKKIIRDHC